jgi:beta-glucosidase
MLRAKFLAGMFEDPYSNADYAEKITNSPEHQALALKAAHESIILLKNENNLLPLTKGRYKRIAVIGPNAAELHLGGYSNQPGRGVSFLQAIKTKVGGSSEVLYSLGSKITETDPDWDADKVVLGDPALNAKRIEEAAKVAAKADIVLLALGGNEQTSREAWAVNHPGDRTNLDLYGNQDDLVKAILATGKPTVVFLQHGSPNTINYIAEHVPAILDGWYLGQEGGAAIADVIFGDYNPGAKLPVTIPRSVGQLPVYYYQKPSGKREYLDSSTLPLYPFGWGLSYATFKYSNVRATPDSIGPQGQTKVTADVTNTGSVRGDEIAQLYIRDEISSVTRPVKELRGFRRISLNPGETKTVEFTLGPDELSFLNRDMHRVVEPGIFTLMVGGNSVDVTTAKLEVVQR